MLPARYAFLVLGLLLAIPGALAYLVRRDLRPAIRLGALLSLPFALTEPIFLADGYWRPGFLFDLGDRLGFGLEDFLFVAALAALAVASYPVVSRRIPTPRPGIERSARAVTRRATALLAAVAVLAAALYASGLPMIDAAPFAMVAGTALAWRTRPDLVTPALVGALVTAAVYHLACVALAAIHPQVFHTVWKDEESLRLFGVPLSELVYAAAAGFAASVFLPHVRGDRLAPIGERGPAHPAGTHRAAQARSR